MNLLAITPTILSSIADNIRRIKEEDSESKYRPTDFNNELSNIYSLDKQLMDEYTKLKISSPSLLEYSFYKATNLKEIEFFHLSEISQYNFYGCSNLEKVIFPQNFSGRLGNYSFSNCSNLEELDVRHCFRINSTFANCSSLKTLILRKIDGVCILNSSSALKDTLIAKGTGRIYVPISLLDKYKSASNWSTYADKIVAIEGTKYEE